MARFLTRAAAVLAAILLALVFIAWLLLRGSLPQLDGQVAAPALTAPARAERDALGTLTVRGESEADVIWTLGYVHAQERFFEMDLMRRSAAGELAELFGAAALPHDRRVRRHRMRAHAAAELEHASAEDRQRIERYRDGVNAGLAALAARPFPYLLTRTTPAPWRSEDTVLVGMAMYFSLNDAENTRELAFSRMHAALPASAYAFLTATGGAWDAPLSDLPLRWPEPPPVQDLDLRKLDPGLLHDPDTEAEGVPGSNSFAVAGALAGGPALIANDMHLPLRVPGLWFRARLMHPDPKDPQWTIDVIGASLPGTPIIVAGSNGQVAWGFTNSYVDSADWVRVVADPGQADHYLASGESLPIQHFAETIQVRGGASETLDVRETRWGPILAEDVDGTPLALAWTAAHVGAVNLALGDLATAETADQAVAIAQRAGMPTQNFLVADRSGNIAWTFAGRLPRREGGFDPSLPSDWSQAGTGWNGWVAAADVPLISNPPGQRLWTANARIVAKGPHLDMVGDGGYDLGARQKQIRDDLRARARFTADDMLAIQLDDRALFLEPWQQRLAALLQGRQDDATREAARLALADWNGHAAIDSVAYRLVRAWRKEVSDKVLSGFAGAVRARYPDFALPKLAQAEHVVWMLLERQPAHLLPPGEESWPALESHALDRVLAAFAKQEGPLKQRSWGERNTARIVHPLSRALPDFIARWLDMPYEPLPGDANMPRVQGPAFGASQRFAVAPGREELGYFELAGGQSGHPLSPFYGAGHADWAAGRPTPFLPGPPQHLLQFKPGP